MRMDFHQVVPGDAQGKRHRRAALGNRSPRNPTSPQRGRHLYRPPTRAAFCCDGLVPRVTRCALHPGLHCVACFCRRLVSPTAWATFRSCGPEPRVTRYALHPGLHCVACFCRRLMPPTCVVRQPTTVGDNVQPRASAIGAPPWETVAPKSHKPAARATPVPPAYAGCVLLRRPGSQGYALRAAPWAALRGLLPQAIDAAHGVGYVSFLRP